MMIRDLQSVTSKDISTRMGLCARTWVRLQSAFMSNFSAQDFARTDSLPPYQKIVDYAHLIIAIHAVSECSKDYQV